MDFSEFVTWFQSNAAQLRQKDPETASAEIHEELQKLDESLGAEVGDETEETRELIITASGNAELFDEVEALAKKLAAEGWTIVPLKPARGFDFTVRTEDSAVDARTLYFEALESPEMPGVLGLRLFAKADQAAALGDTAWWILETGIGERASAYIQHLEVAELPEDTNDLTSVRALGSFVRWHQGRKQGQPRS